jgi:hypothetical protein
MTWRKRSSGCPAQKNQPCKDFDPECTIIAQWSFQCQMPQKRGMIVHVPLVEFHDQKPSLPSDRQRVGGLFAVLRQPAPRPHRAWDNELQRA